VRRPLIALLRSDKGVARSDDSNVGLFAASIVWRAFVDRHAVKSFRS
jgi:hypothetical protein